MRHVIPTLFLLSCAVAAVLWTCVIIAFFVAYHVVVAKFLFIERHCLVLFLAPHRHWVCIVFFHKFAWGLLWMFHLYDSWRKQFLAILSFLTSVWWTSWIMSPIWKVFHCTSRKHNSIFDARHQNTTCILTYHIVSICYFCLYVTRPYNNYYKTSCFY